MNRLWTPITTLCSVIVSSIALAAPQGNAPEGAARQHHRHGGTVLFERLDKNKNGKVTRDEARQAKTARFNAMDKNRDGVLTQQEAQAARQDQHRHIAEERFAQRDTDKDGRLSKAESGMPEERFARLDTDGDGVLSKEELQARHRKGAPERANRGPFGRLDTNNDGKLTRQEAERGVDQMFERLDADKNGSLSKPELESSHKPRNGKRHNAGEKREQRNQNGKQQRRTHERGGRPA